MNKALIVFCIIIIAISCGKKEEVKFEAFSPEAFAYDIGDSWEVNATVNVRGFQTSKKDIYLNASISFNVDVVNPAGEIMKNVFSNSAAFSEKELLDVQLEAQFELEKTYANGIYEIIFNIKDNLSGKTTSDKVSFELAD